jgi:phosphoglycolate phosphatase-like HAD superfamily hydrolase
MFVVFDLDGTLANTDHRAHFLDGTDGKKDWRGFYAACDQDAPHWPIVHTLHALANANHRVEIWSGRSDEVRDKTEAWLREHFLNDIPLRMRAEGDYTADDVLKRGWLANGKPDLIFDDRDKVVAMWRAQGIPCCQVAPGNF